MDFILEIILSILGVLLELIFDVFILWRLDYFPEARRAHERAKASTRVDDGTTPRNSFLRGLVYAFIGAGLGWLSMKIFPSLWLHSPGLQRLNIVLSPLLGGLFYTLFKSWLYSKRFQQPIIWHWLWFFQALFFALAFNATRYYLAHHAS